MGAAKYCMRHAGTELHFKKRWHMHIKCLVVNAHLYHALTAMTASIESASLSLLSSDSRIQEHHRAQFLSAREDLDDYVKPSRGELLDVIPRLKDGRPDEDCLAKFAPKADLCVAPRNNVEARVLQIFASILALHPGRPLALSRVIPA
jgi:hypothetical protein